MDLIVYQPITTKTIVEIIDRLRESFPVTIEKKQECSFNIGNKSVRFENMMSPWFHDDAYNEWKNGKEIAIYSDEKYILSLNFIGDWSQVESQIFLDALKPITTRPTKIINPDLIPLPNNITAIIVTCLCDDITSHFSEAEIKAFKQMYFLGKIVNLSDAKFSVRNENNALWYIDNTVSIIIDKYDYSIGQNNEIEIVDMKNHLIFQDINNEFILHRGINDDRREPKPNEIPKISPEIIASFDRTGEFNLAQKLAIFIGYTDTIACQKYVDEIKR